MRPLAICSEYGLSSIRLDNLVESNKQIVRDSGKKMELADEQLITSARNGDSSAYAALFEKYQSGIYNFAYSLVRSTEDAKDIAQEAFIKVFEALPRLEEKAKFSSYLYRTARNLAMDTLKAENRYGSAESLELEKDTDIESDPQRSLLLQEQQSEVQKTAADLADDYRMVLSLRELQDLSYDEISSVMEIPKNSVGVLLLRARLKFKQEFRMSQVDVEKLSKECKKMLPLLSAYIDNELSEEEREEVKQHLDDCPLCHLALEEMTEASKSYRGFIPILPPPDLKANVFAHIRNQIEGEFKVPDTQESNVSGDAGSEVTQKMSAQETAVQAPKPTTDASGTEQEMLATANGILTKEKGVKTIGLSGSKKALIVLAALLVIAGILLTVITIYGQQSIARPEIDDLTPYNHNFPNELMEYAPQAQENILLLSSGLGSEEELTETEEDGTDIRTFGQTEPEDEANPGAPEDEEPSQQEPGGESTETPETPPNESPNQTPDSNPNQNLDPNSAFKPLFPELIPIEPIKPIDPIDPVY